MGFQTTDWKPGDPGNTILGKILTVLKSGASFVVNRISGSAHIAASQFTTSVTAAEALPARTTRRKVLVKNTHFAITIYLGADSTTSSITGYWLVAGTTIELETTAAIWAASVSDTPILSFLEIYD